MITCFLMIGAMVVLSGMHERTAGRSSPAAAVGFVLGGPVLGVLLLIPAAFKEAKQMSMGGTEPATVYGFSIEDYVIIMFQAGLASALVSGAVYSASIRSELHDERDFDPTSRPRPLASPALHALGLNAFASQDDVEQAFRQRAQIDHPDKGGDELKFKRLQRNYELAKRYVARQH